MENDLPEWLRVETEKLKRRYNHWLELQIEVGKFKRKVIPHEIKAEIEILTKAEAILEKRNLSHSHGDRPSHLAEDERERARHDRRDFALHKIGILNIRRERRRLASLLRRSKSPRGRQMNYMLDFYVWCFAEKIKKNTGKPNWELVAQLLSDLSPNEVMDANQALKAHRRIAKLRNDREKFNRVMASNGINNNYFGRDFEILKKRTHSNGPRPNSTRKLSETSWQG